MHVAFSIMLSNKEIPSTLCEFIAFNCKHNYSVPGTSTTGKKNSPHNWNTGSLLPLSLLRTKKKKMNLNNKPPTAVELRTLYIWLIFCCVI